MDQSFALSFELCICSANIKASSMDLQLSPLEAHHPPSKHLVDPLASEIRGKSGQSLGLSLNRRQQVDDLDSLELLGVLCLFPAEIPPVHGHHQNTSFTCLHSRELFAHSRMDAFL